MTSLNMSSVLDRWQDERFASIAPPTPYRMKDWPFEDGIAGSQQAPITMPPRLDYGAKNTPFKRAPKALCILIQLTNLPWQKEDLSCDA